MMVITFMMIINVIKFLPMAAHRCHDDHYGNDLDLMVIVMMRMVIMVIIKVVKCLPMGVPKTMKDASRLYCKIISSCCS